MQNPQLPHQHSVPIIGSITPVSINKFKKEEEKTLFTNNLHTFHKHLLKITKSISYYIFVYILMTDLTNREMETVCVNKIIIFPTKKINRK